MSEDFRVSVSKTKTFKQCKKQYNFNYNLKMPKKDRDYHFTGKFCHMVLEEFHQEYIKGCFLPYNMVMGDCFKKAQIAYKSHMTSEMIKECWEIIDQYLKVVSAQKNNGSPANVIAVEKRFELTVDKNIILNGAIDRIQLDDDNVLHVSDYKTTKNKKYLKDDWFQLLTYAFVLMTDDPSLEVVRASYILLRHNIEYITTQFHRPKVMEIKNQYIDFVSQMKSEKAFEANPSALCLYCDFLDLCDEGREKAGQIKPNMIYGEVNW